MGFMILGKPVSLVSGTSVTNANRNMLTRLFCFYMPHTCGRIALNKEECCRVKPRCQRSASCLPDQFEPQLNLTRGRGRGTNNPSVAGADGIVSII